MLAKQITRRSLVKCLALGAAVPLAFAADEELEVSVMEFNDAGEKTGLVRVKKVAHTEAEWRKLLTLQQFYVTRKASSDLPYYGSYFKLRDAGIYRCICCVQLNGEIREQDRLPVFLGAHRGGKHPYLCGCGGRAQAG